VTIFTDSDDLAAHAADRITQGTQQAIRARGRAMLALAGGATPEQTYRVLAQPARRRRVDWARTYLFFGD
jgi:6-phosphogluconolactonase